jgi:hypothetical protein
VDASGACVAPNHPELGVACALLGGKSMTTLRRTKARPLLLALASTATIAFGCGGKDDGHPSGNLMASNTDLLEHDQAIEIGDAGPSGNLMAAPDDMGNE